MDSQIGLSKWTLKLDSQIEGRAMAEKNGEWNAKEDILSARRRKGNLQKNCIISSCVICTNLQIKSTDEINKNYRVGFRLSFRKGNVKSINVLSEKLSDVDIDKKIILKWALK